MSEHTTTDCLLFPDIFDRPVVAKFDQRQGSSDGGAILLQAAERRLGLTSTLAGCLRGDRQAGKVLHKLHKLIAQRVMDIALGYEDASDAARLAGASPQITNQDGSQSPSVIPKGNVFVVTDISITVPPFLPRSRA